MAAVKKEKKRRRRSLSKSIMRMVLLVALVVFLASNIVNAYLSVHEVASLMSVTGQLFSEQLHRDVSQVEGLEEFAARVMETYRSIPADVRKNADSKEYHSYTEELEKDPVYEQLRYVLEDVPESAINESAYLAMYDEETSRVVYIADSDTWGDKNICLPGFSEEVLPEEIQAFMSDDSPSYESVPENLPGEDAGEGETELLT